MSDAFRLLMGDARRTPFAMTFYRLFVASPYGEPLPRPDWGAADLPAELARLEAATEYRYEDELLGRMLVESWNGNRVAAATLLEAAMDHYGTGARPDPVIHFASMRFPSGRAKQKGLEMGESLLAEHPDNRWILMAQAELLQDAGDTARAGELLERALNLPNQNDDFVHRLMQGSFHLSLARILWDTDREAARPHLIKTLDSPLDGDARREAEAMLAELPPSSTTTD